MPFLTPYMIFSLSFANIDQAQEQPIEGWLHERVLTPEAVRQEMDAFTSAQVPPLTRPNSAEVWTRQADALRQRLLDDVVFRGVPDEWARWHANVVWGDTIATEKGYQIRKLRYEALPGLWVPALLYEPTEIQEDIPAVLNVNGHVGPIGKAIGYEQLRCINLAKQGMLALHPEWLVFGELVGEDYKHNRLAYLDLCGMSGVSVFYLAMRGGLDVLLDHPNTDSQRVAMTGLSGGGWQTILLSALDTRITLSVPNAGYIDLQNRIDHRSDIGDLEQNPTDLVSIADYTYLTAMLAPRPALLIYNEKDDCCFVADRAKPAVFDPIMPFYQLLGAEEGFEYYKNIKPGTHNYDRDNREQFYRFINRHFFPRLELSHEEPYADDELVSQDELNAGIPEGNQNFHTLAHEHLQTLPKYRAPVGDPTAFKTWQEEGRKRLGDVLRLKTLSGDGVFIRRESKNDLKAEWHKLTVGTEWTLPVVALSKENSQNTVIAIADEGRAESASWVETLVNEGLRVIAVDLLFMGECVPESIPVPQYTMMMSTAGERPLGIQIAQLRAVIDWVCEAYGVSHVSLHSNGWTSGIVATAAAGLSHERVNRVVAEDALPSLKRLVDDHLDYERCPTLFCFGLLEQFDVDELIALCSPIKVTRK